jgi:hypothetical protein
MCARGHLDIRGMSTGVSDIHAAKSKGEQQAIDRKNHLVHEGSRTIRTAPLMSDSNKYGARE